MISVLKNHWSYLGYITHNLAAAYIDSGKRK